MTGSERSASNVCTNELKEDRTGNKETNDPVKIPLKLPLKRKETENNNKENRPKQIKTTANDNNTYPCYKCKYMCKDKEELLNHLESVHDLDVGSVLCSLGKPKKKKRSRSSSQNKNTSKREKIDFDKIKVKIEKVKIKQEKIDSDDDKMLSELISKKTSNERYFK